MNPMFGTVAYCAYQDSGARASACEVYSSKLAFSLGGQSTPGERAVLF